MVIDLSINSGENPIDISISSEDEDDAILVFTPFKNSVKPPSPDAKLTPTECLGKIIKIRQDTKIRRENEKRAAVERERKWLGNFFRQPPGSDDETFLPPTAPPQRNSRNRHNRRR